MEKIFATEENKSVSAKEGVQSVAAIVKLSGATENEKNTAIVSDNLGDSKENVRITSIASDDIDEWKDNPPVISFAASSPHGLGKKFFSMVTFTALNEIIVNSEFFVKTFIYAQISDDALAGSNLITATLLLTIATAKARISSVRIIATRSPVDELGQVFRHSYLQAIIETLILLLPLSFGEKIFLGLGQPSAAAKIAGDYLLYHNIAIPAILLLFSSQMFAIGVKRPKIAVISTSVNVAITLVLSAILSLGLFGTKDYGIQGMAYATAISNWAAFIILCIYFFAFDKEFKSYNLLRFMSFSKTTLSMLFAVGMPIGFQVMADFGYNFIITTWIGTISQNALVAAQVASQYLGLMLSPLVATALTTSVLMGEDISKNGFEAIKKIFVIGTLLALSIAVFGTLAFSFLSPYLSKPFLDAGNQNYDEVFSLTKSLFVLNGVNLLPEALKQVSTFALSSFYDTAVPTLIAVSFLGLVSLPVSYLLSTTDLHVKGLFVGKGMALFLMSIALAYRTRKKLNDPRSAIEEGKMNFFIRCKKTMNNCWKRANLAEKTALTSGVSVSDQPHTTTVTRRRGLCC